MTSKLSSVVASRTFNEVRALTTPDGRTITTIYANRAIRSRRAVIDFVGDDHAGTATSMMTGPSLGRVPGLGWTKASGGGLITSDVVTRSLTGKVLTDLPRTVGASNPDDPMRRALWCR